MPRYIHPGPVEIRLDLVAGDARVVASPRDDIVVEVAPRDPARDADVRAAGEVRVSLVRDRLEVRRGGRRGAVEVSICVPEGSRLRARTGAGDIMSEGALEDCSIRTGAGEVRLGRVGTLSVTSGRGDVAVEEAAGAAALTTGSGSIRVGRVAAGEADLRTAAGDIEVGIAEGSAAHLDLRSGRGTVVQELERLPAPPPDGPRAGVRARTGTGDVVVRRA